MLVTRMAPLYAQEGVGQNTEPGYFPSHETPVRRPSREQLGAHTIVCDPQTCDACFVGGPLGVGHPGDEHAVLPAMTREVSEDAARDPRLRPELDGFWQGELLPVLVQFVHSRFHYQ